MEFYDFFFLWKKLSAKYLQYTWKERRGKWRENTKKNLFGVQRLWNLSLEYRRNITVSRCHFLPDQITTTIFWDFFFPTFNELTIDEDLNFKDLAKQKGEKIKWQQSKKNPAFRRGRGGRPEANYTSHFAFFITKESKQK